MYPEKIDWFDPEKYKEPRRFTEIVHHLDGNSDNERSENRMHCHLACHTRHHNILDGRKPPPREGTYVEMYGTKRAKEIRKKISIAMKGNRNNSQ